MDMTKILDWINDPGVKAILLLGGGFLMSRWGPFVKKAVPMLLLVASALVQAIHSMFPGVEGAVPAGYATAALLPVKGIGGFVMGSLIPALLAIGIHSGSKNTRQWAELGMALSKPRK